MSLITVAKPYAKAAFTHAKQQQAIPAWAEALKACAEICLDQDFQQLIASPVVSNQQINEILLEALDNNYPEGFEEFITVISEYNRYALLGIIADDFQQRLAQHQQIFSGTVTSAIALDTTQQNQIKQALAKRYAGVVDLEFSTDSSLIAGFVIKMNDDNVIDASIASRLAQLESRLTL